MKLFENLTKRAHFCLISNLTKNHQQLSRKPVKSQAWGALGGLWAPLGDLGDAKRLPERQK